MEQDNFFNDYLSLLEQHLPAAEEQAPAAPEEDDFITNLRAYDDEQEKLSESDKLKQMFDSYIRKIDERLGYVDRDAEDRDIFSDYDETDLTNHYDTRLNPAPYFSKPMTGGINQLAEAIGQYESSNNHKALGPVVPSGRYAGQRALGKYQIMPGNLPQWSREAVGREVSEQEFLNSPELQDKIAKHQMEKLYNQYGNEEDVASAWLTGQPRGRSKARDVNNIGSEEYINNVAKYY